MNCFSYDITTTSKLKIERERERNRNRNKNRNKKEKEKKKKINPATSQINNRTKPAKNTKNIRLC